MAQNVGGIDRLSRLALGVAAIAAGLLNDGPWRWLILVGAVLAATALIRFCPAYWLLRIRTSASGGTVDR